MADENTAIGQGTEEAQTASAEPSGQRTFTQDEVNRLVGDARQKERRKYEGFVDGSELEQARADAKAAADELAQLKAKQARADAVAKAAKEAGVASDVVAMLNGSDADELAAQVRRLLELLPVHPARTDDGGTGATSKRSTAQMFADALGDIL